MSTTTIQIKGSKRELRKAIKHLPGYISGAVPDVYGIGRTFKAFFAQAFWERVHKAYEVKSTGGADDTGTKWKPLSPATIAQRPLVPGERKSLGIKRNEKVRGLLTPQQDLLWKGIFASTFKRLIAQGYGAGQAKAEAGQLAWAILKKMGAKTKLEVLGKRNVPIGIDSGDLYEATTPGKASVAGYQPPPNQKFISRRGGIEIGIKLPYATKFHKVRRIWPAAYRMRPWTTYASRKALQAVVDLLAQGKSLTKR